MSSYGNQDGNLPPVAQITVKGDINGEDISQCDEDSILGMSFKSVDSKALADHVAGGKEREDDGDSKVSDKIRRAVLYSSFESEDVFGSELKRRRVANPGIKTYVTKAIKERIYSTLDAIASSGEEPSIEHPGMQNIKMDHQLQDDQISRQIKNWSEQKQSTPTRRPESADAEKKAGDTCGKTPVYYACIKRRDSFTFSAKFIDEPFLGPDDPMHFGEDVVWAVNFLHEKGYTYVKNEEDQDDWKEMLNSKRNDPKANDEDRSNEPRTVGIFSKDVGTTEKKLRTDRPMMLAIFQEPRNSRKVHTDKEGKFRLRGAGNESKYDVIEEAIREARRSGYEKMDIDKAKYWKSMITNFLEEDLFYPAMYGLPEEIEEGLFDRVVGVFEKKSKS